jgi:NADP-dependent 3-hydroxy acid dehydrogenase YdfG
LVAKDLPTTVMAWTATIDNPPSVRSISKEDDDDAQGGAAMTARTTASDRHDESVESGPMPAIDRRGVVVITGGTAGVGRACARAFAASGYDIGLIARGGDRLEAAQAEIEATGRRAHVVSVDVATAAAVDDAATEFEAVLGPIDIWVNDAMTSVLAPVDVLAAGEIHRVTDVTYHGTVHGTQAALRRMTERDRGTIVQIGSALAYRSIPLQSAYCAAKAAVRAFTDSLRCELIHNGSNVRLTMVQLPAINTPQFGWVRNRLPRRAQPVPPVFQPEVAARAVVWAAENAPREMHVGLPTVLALLGQTIAPGLMDRYLARAAWEGQMTGQPRDPDAEDNLWAPVAGEIAAHGSFDEDASSDSAELWAATHPTAVRAALAAGLAGLGLLALRRAR